MAKINIYGSLWNNLSTRKEKIIAYGSQIDGAHIQIPDTQDAEALPNIWPSQDDTYLDGTKIWSENLAVGNQYDINRWFVSRIKALQDDYSSISSALVFRGTFSGESFPPADYTPEAGDVWHLNTSITIGGTEYQSGDDIVYVKPTDSEGYWDLLGKNDALAGTGVITKVTVERGSLNPDTVNVVTTKYGGDVNPPSNIPLATYGSGGFKAGLLSSTDKQKLNLTSNFAYVGVVPARVDIIGGSGAYYYPWTTPLITNMLKYNINLGGNNYTAPSEYAAGYPRPGYIYKLQGSLTLRTSATDTKMFNPGDYVYCCEVKSVKKTSDSTGDWEENGMNYVAYFKKFENFYVEERLDPKNINIAWLEAPYDESDIDSPIPGGGGSGGTTNEWIGGNVTESGDEVFDKVDNPADIIIGGPASEYLTLTAIEGGTLSFTGDGLSYSTDNGINWKTLNANVGMPVGPGKSVIFKGKYDSTTKSIGQFKMKSKFNLSGNIMSLLFGDNFVGKTDLTGYDNVFEYMFQETGVVDASKLILPATKLSTYCYGRMFYNCSSLTAVPELPATTLAEQCYNSMFYGCTSLTTAPELPATTLAASCYVDMFHGCSSLTAAPELPATTLASSCYNSMFYGCTSLTAAPELPATDFHSSPSATYCCQSMFYGCSSLTTAPSVLPATELVNFCYSSMFNGCTSLTTAPKLPATTLVNGCYNKMFSGCSKLNHIEAVFTTTPNTLYTDSWVSGVSSTGTFVKNAAATWNVTGTSGIPEGWTVMTVVVDAPAQPLNA